MLKEMDSASPRISGILESFVRVRNLSRWVWMFMVPGVSGDAMHMKDSSGEMASRVAERMPNLSQLRYL